MIKIPLNRIGEFFIRNRKGIFRGVKKASPYFIAGTYIAFQTLREIKKMKLSDLESLKIINNRIRDLEEEMSKIQKDSFKSLKLQQAVSILKSKAEAYDKNDKEADMAGKRFVPGNTKVNSKGYQYGLFANEIESMYYIDKIDLEKVLNDISWETNEREELFLKYLVKAEEIHKDYCLQKCSKEDCLLKIDELLEIYHKESGYYFGENVDKLNNYLIRSLVG